MDEKWSNSISVVVHNVYVHYCKLLTSTVVLDFTAISPCKVLIISSQSFSCITQTQTDRQTDRQTERQTDTETYIDRDTHTEIMNIHPVYILYNHTSCSSLSQGPLV